jgi:hypothetical protein
MNLRCVVQAYINGRATVTALGGNQRTILNSLRHNEGLSFTELKRETGLEHIQVVVATRQLIKAEVLQYVWTKDGRAVYRLKGK